MALIYVRLSCTNCFTVVKLLLCWKYYSSVELVGGLCFPIGRTSFLILPLKQKSDLKAFQLPPITTILNVFSAWDFKDVQKLVHCWCIGDSINPFFFCVCDGVRDVCFGPAAVHGMAMNLYFQLLQGQLQWRWSLKDFEGLGRENNCGMGRHLVLCFCFCKNDCKTFSAWMAKLGMLIIKQLWSYVFVFL